MNLGIHRDSQFENVGTTTTGELFVDVIEPSWFNDVLPIDDIPLPDHLKLQGVGDDTETFVEIAEPSHQEITTWIDLNLESFN